MIAEAATTPVLALRGVVKRYGHVEALRGADLELQAGEIHALLGDNGAGKSTLLKIAAGVIQPDEGEIRLAGQHVHLGSPWQARELGIETVYQDLALAGERSCAANVFIGRELRRGGLLGKLGFLDRAEMAAQVRRAFADLSVPITQVERPVKMLSGGQRQGVAIARAARWATRVLLLDEPTAALGVRQRAAVSAMIARLRERHFGILLISHDVPEVLKVADRVTVLRLGRVVATRPIADVSRDWIVTSMVSGGEDE